jgi:hypothetical protein
MFDVNITVTSLENLSNLSISAAVDQVLRKKSFLTTAREVTAATGDDA